MAARITVTVLVSVSNAYDKLNSPPKWVQTIPESFSPVGGLSSLCSSLSSLNNGAMVAECNSRLCLSWDHQIANQNHQKSTLLFLYNKQTRSIPCPLSLSNQTFALQQQDDIVHNSMHVLLAHIHNQIRPSGLLIRIINPGKTFDFTSSRPCINPFAIGFFLLISPKRPFTGDIRWKIPHVQGA